jgi:hypothetical protein
MPATASSDRLRCVVALDGSVLVRRLDAYLPNMHDEDDDSDDGSLVLNVLATIERIRQMYPSVLLVWRMS